MKFKQSEEQGKPQSNSFLDSITDLIVVSIRFMYAIKSMNLKECCELNLLKNAIINDYEDLTKLATCLNSTHKLPAMTVDFVPAESIDDLKILEEKYYNMLKEIANNALEENNAEVFSYLSPMINTFNHYFCTLDEDNDSRKISS